jgi:hypothetical protein
LESALYGILSEMVFLITLSGFDELASIYRGDHVFGLLLMLSIYKCCRQMPLSWPGKEDDRNSESLVAEKLGQERIDLRDNVLFAGRRAFAHSTPVILHNHPRQHGPERAHRWHADVAHLEGSSELFLNHRNY